MAESRGTGKQRGLDRGRVPVSERESEPAPWIPPVGSHASSPGNLKSMRSNRPRDTKPELAVRRLLHAAGLRYRVARRPVPQVRRTADVVFGPVKVAVFIDGCYWHGCPEHGQRPKTNAEFWNAKIDGNVRRDRETDRLLAEAGWTVLRYWEHEPAAECAARIIEAVLARRSR